MACPKGCRRQSMLRLQAHQLRIVELTIGKLIHAFGDQRGQASHPHRFTVFKVRITRHTHDIAKNRVAANHAETGPLPEGTPG